VPHMPHSVSKTALLRAKAVGHGSVLDAPPMPHPCPTMPHSNEVWSQRWKPTDSHGRTSEASRAAAVAWLVARPADGAPRVPLATRLRAQADRATRRTANRGRSSSTWAPVDQMALGSVREKPDQRAIVANRRECP